jgi:DeoR family fructose operon transcriptional repressor
VFAEERQRAIVERLRQFGSVTVEELAETFGVSAPTIRGDLARLEGRGLLVRAHGGAIRADGTLYEPSHEDRRVMRRDEKKAIARAASEMVKNGETILLDAGTTSLELALLLQAKHALTVVTNSLANAMVLMDSQNVDVIMVGGQLQRRRRAALGPLAVRFLDGFRVDRAFMGFNGVDAAGGLTVVDFDAAEIKRKMMAAASQCVVIADSDKIGRVAFAAVAPIVAAGVVLTDKGADPSALAQINDLGVRVEVAEV